MSENNIPNELRGIIDITYLNRDNCTITDKNGFLGLRAIVPKRDEPFETENEKKPPRPDGDKDGEGKKRDKPAIIKNDLGDGTVELVAERIHLSRAFPFDMPFEYISVLDNDKKEIGLIRTLEDFDEDTRTLLIDELEAKYYTPTIKRILSVKERYGFSFWRCECEFGEKSFTLRDTFRSIIRARTRDGKARIFILDVDGNRYEIPDVEALDRTSYKKIELYL